MVVKKHTWLTMWQSQTLSSFVVIGLQISSTWYIRKDSSQGRTLDRNSLELRSSNREHTNCRNQSKMFWASNCVMELRLSTWPYAIFSPLFPLRPNYVWIWKQCFGKKTAFRITEKKLRMYRNSDYNYHQNNCKINKPTRRVFLYINSQKCWKDQQVQASPGLIV